MSYHSTSTKPSTRFFVARKFLGVDGFVFHVCDRLNDGLPVTVAGFLRQLDAEAFAHDMNTGIDYPW